MGIATSPFRDRVIFVVGAARSGTTWLAALFATHPQVAGITGETHLFDLGVDRLFDNFERQDWEMLSSFVSREDVVDLVRDLCDGVFVRTKERIKPTADFLMEKTPLNLEHLIAGRGRLELERKLECYPDAWYVHVVRDPSPAGRSLTRTSWAPKHDRPDQLIARSAAQVRGVLGDHERYREISYETLVHDTVGVMSGLFAWIGLDDSDEARERVRMVSMDRYAQGRGARPAVIPSEGDGFVGAIRASLAKAQGKLFRSRRSSSGSSSSEAQGSRSLIERFGRSLRFGDLPALADVTTQNVVLELHSAAGDLRVEGDDARRSLLALMKELFGGALVGGRWEAAVGDQFHSILVTGMTADVERIDTSIALTVFGDLISRIVLISPGTPLRRQAKVWDPGALSE